MPGRIKYQMAPHDNRLALRIVALTGELTAPDQRPDALDQKPLREGLSDVIIGAHPEPEQLVDFVILGCQKDYRDMALPPKLAEQLHAVHPRHLDVEYGNIDRLGT